MVEVEGTGAVFDSEAAKLGACFALEAVGVEGLLFPAAVADKLLAVRERPPPPPGCNVLLLLLLLLLLLFSGCG